MRIEERKKVALIAKKCITKDYDLSMSMYRILTLLKENPNMPVPQFCRLVVRKRIVRSVQVVRNYLTALRKLGLINRPSKNIRKVLI